VLVPASFATTAFFLFFQQGTKAVLADNDTTKRKIDAVHSDMNVYHVAQGRSGASA
jgi:hypothetical protein